MTFKKKIKFRITKAPFACEKTFSTKTLSHFLIFRTLRKIGQWNIFLVKEKIKLFLRKKHRGIPFHEFENFISTTKIDIHKFINILYCLTSQSNNGNKLFSWKIFFTCKLFPWNKWGPRAMSKKWFL